MHRPGFEPGSLAWKARIIAIRPSVRKLREKFQFIKLTKKEKLVCPFKAL